MYSNKILFITIILVCFSLMSQAQIWPINQTDDPNNWNSISASFGEIHPTNGNHFHGAVDIDVTTLNCPVRAIENGRVSASGGMSITLTHVYPAGSGNYDRKSRYLHVNGSSNLSVGSNVNQGDQITSVQASSGNPGTADHLHFEMWQFIDGVWYKINPFGNPTGWQLGSPVDTTPPQINDVFLEGVNQPANNVPSGFTIYRNGGGLTNRNTNVKAHFRNRSGSTGTVFNATNDRLVVFGNIIPTVSARDVSINSAAAADGLTIHKLNYKIDGDLKYDIFFDKITEAEQFQVSEIFHTEFNNGDLLFGNNDFIELYTTNGVYLTPDKNVNSLISNGVWFTKARSATQNVYANTPSDVASYPADALYQDGNHTLLFRTEDAVALSDEATMEVVVDNFRPYVKEVIIRRNGQFGTVLYRGYWEWDATTSKLVFKKPVLNDANPGDKIWIKITTSEPVQNLQTNIPSVDFSTYHTDITPYNSSNTEFIIVYNPISASGTQTLNIQALDFAGNALQSDPSVIPIHQADGTWLPAPNAGVDSNHKFHTGTNFCTGFTGGRLASTSSTSTPSECLYADVSTDETTVQLNQAVTYTPITSGNGQISYQWDFGSGAVPSTSTSSGSQTVVYTTSGAKTVTLKICDNTLQCITQTKTNIVTIGQPASILTVDFGTDRYAASTGQDIQLTSIVSGAVGTVSYSWDFGDQVTKGYFSDVNPLIAYNYPGYKTVRLTVTDANGSVTKVRNNYITVNSIASSINVTITGCGPSDGTGKINSLGAFVSGGYGAPYKSYLWDFGDGVTSTLASPGSHTYKKGGTYTVRLTICDDSGCSTGQSAGCVIVPTTVGSTTLTPGFNVNDVNPIGNFVQQVSLNTPVKFTGFTTGGSGNPRKFIYQWDFESHYNNSNGIESAYPSTSSTVGPVAQEVYYTVTGQKEVSLVVVDSVTSKRITISDAVEVVTGRGSGTCYATIGEITLSSTCWTANNKPKFTVPITGNNCPIAKVEVMADGYVLPNGVVDFVNFAPGTIPKFPYTSDNFTFTVYQYDGLNYNRIGYKRQKFTIYGPVAADAGPDKQVCLGATTIIGSEPSADKIYQWSSATAPLNFLSSLTTANPTFSGIQKGTYAYTVTVTDKVGGCSSSDQVSITVDRPDAKPGSTFAPLSVATPVAVSVTGGFGSNVYAWTPADNLSSTNAASPLFTSTTAGDFNYMVTVTDGNGCYSSAQAFVNASSKPGNLIATAAGYSRIALTWIDRTTNETGFVIQRSNDGSTFSDYTTVGPNVQAFDDLSVQRGTTYTYRVAAKVAGVNSDFSNIAATSTDVLPQFSIIDNGPGSRTYGDFDNDGDIDYVKVTFTSQVQIDFYTNTNGSYALTQTFNTAGYWCKLIAGDYDNDNDLDVFLVPWSATTANIVVLVNQNFVFNMITTPLQVISSTRLDQFDFNRDNAVDLMSANIYSMYLTASGLQAYQIYSNKGNNTFSMVDTDIKISGVNDVGYSGSIFGFSDFDGDGDEDFISAMGGSTSLYIFPNNNGFSVANKTEILSSCCNSNGAVEVGDFNNDKKRDVLQALGNASGNASNALKNNGNLQFSNVSISPGISSGNVQFSDFDSDGDLDLFTSSNGNGKIFTNDAGSFNTAFSLAGDLGTWFDFDGDGDMDIVSEVLNTAYVNGKVFVNNTGTNKNQRNTPPTSPTNLCTYYNHDQVTFSWGHGGDAETPSAGLTYNLYVKQNGNFIVSPLADLVTGFRKVLKRGNMDQNTSWTLTIPSSADIEWGVQAIDNSYVGSAFAKNTVSPTTTVCGPVTTSKTVDSKDIITPQNCSPLSTSVSNGATLTLQAGNSIRLLPGFTVAAGSYLTGRLTNYTQDNSPCLSNGRDDDPSASQTVENKMDEVYVYPNPNNGVFNISASFSEMHEYIRIDVIDMSGNAIIKKQKDEIQLLEDSIDVSDVAQGVYIVRFVFENGRILNKKIVKL